MENYIEDAHNSMNQTKLNLTCTVKILPDEKTKKMLLRVLRSYRDACNFISQYAFYYKETSPLRLNKRFYNVIRKKYGLPSQITQSVMRTVASKYKMMKTTDEWSKVQFKRLHASWIFGRDMRFKNNMVKLTTLAGSVSIPLIKDGCEKYFDDNWKFGTGRIKINNGEWFLELSVSKDVPILAAEDVACVVGVDMGLNFIATTYDSNGKTTFYSGRKEKHQRQQFQNMRRQLEKKDTPSANRRLDALGHKESLFISDFTHRIAKSLVESYPPDTIFVLEDLKGFSEYLQSNHGGSFSALAMLPYADLREKIQYKALQHGSRVIVVDPKYTSIRCPKCRNISRENRDRKLHHFKCTECGYQSNDDRIGAMNIYQRGLAILESLRMSNAA